MGRGRDGEEIESGDTYHSFPTISEGEPAEDSIAEAVLDGNPQGEEPIRPRPARPDLPVTGAIGWLDARIAAQEQRNRRLERAVWLLALVVGGLEILWWTR
jgi:hypothetical protein